MASNSISIILPSLIDVRNNKIIAKENNRVEFKTAFSMGSKYKYAKILASFANNKGGLLIFGVDENTGTIIGLKNEKFDKLDPADFTQLLNECFDPELIWDQKIENIDENTRVGIINVEECEDKPIICKKNAIGLIEGEIYYRYSGQTKRIRFSEISRIIQLEKQKLVNLFFEKVNEIKSIGIRDSLIIDTKLNEIQGKNQKILIDKNVLSELKLIENGKFVEHDGLPTLKLIGELNPIDVVTRIQVKNLKAFDIVTAFLKQEIPLGIEPIEYILQIGNESSQNFPIYYFIKESGITIDEIRELVIKSLPGNHYKSKLIKRLIGPDNKFFISKININSQASKKRKIYLESAIKESFNIDILENEKDIQYLLEGLTNISKEDITTKKDIIFPILHEIYKKNYRKSIASAFRNLICLFDIYLYKN
ncbi:MAG: hypothetical protein HeimC3_53850 [Candidatus Heimdallarchaeota archaeon LC_3]|nr:MAG: hypothetical protein HeimC3_53850 [Candidatus Heimdallarchaeota archaeon LC_3]